MKPIEKTKLAITFLLMVVVTITATFPPKTFAQTEMGVKKTNIAPLQKDLKSSLGLYQQKRFDTLFGNQSVNSQTLSDSNFLKEDFPGSNNGNAARKGGKKWWIIPVLIGVGVVIYFVAKNASSSGIPCNDGTVSNAANRQGACSHHGGIRD